VGVDVHGLWEGMDICGRACCKKLVDENGGWAEAAELGDIKGEAKKCWGGPEGGGLGMGIYEGEKGIGPDSGIAKEGWWRGELTDKGTGCCCRGRGWMVGRGCNVTDAASGAVEASAGWVLGSGRENGASWWDRFPLAGIL